MINVVVSGCNGAMGRVLTKAIEGNGRYNNSCWDR